jgi:hypothetical protein
MHLAKEGRMDREENSKKLWVGVVVVAVIAIGAGLLYWYYQTPVEVPPPALEEPKAEKPSPPPVAEPGGEKPGESLPAPPVTAEIPLPDLNQSDEFARNMMKGLSPNSKLLDWLQISNIIRVIAASVDNVADGLSPRPHLRFLSPGKAFTVDDKEGKLYLDPKSYRRYDLVADVFASLDAARTIKVYNGLKPLFQQAYRELGYPDRDFQDTLIQAMLRLLSTPVVKREILLTEAEKGINYRIVDDYLENLSDAEKHLLRMGPENTRKIQKKLREMVLALGVPEAKLPRVQMYIPAVK